MPDAEKLLTSSEVGALINKSARTVSRLAQKGELPHATRLAAGNGLYLFRLADIDKYIAEHDQAFVGPAAGHHQGGAQ